MALPDYFAFYGLPQSFHPDAAAVRRQYYVQSRAFHPDRVQGGDVLAMREALTMSALNNEAYRTLQDEDRTMGYILRLHGVVGEEEAYKLPPAFLMEMMELNEAVGNVEKTPDMHPEAMREFEMAMNDWEQATAPLKKRFEEGERSEGLFAALKDYYYRRKYLLRIKDRLL